MRIVLAIVIATVVIPGCQSEPPEADSYVATKNSLRPVVAEEAPLERGPALQTIQGTGLDADPFVIAYARSEEISGARAYPLRISGDQRSVVDANGQTFVMNGDTPWSLAVQLTRTEIGQYLDDRANLGLNAIMFNLIEHKFGDANPEPWTNQNGDDPFTRTLSIGSFDFTAPNEKYWSEVDWIVNEAHKRGMVCLLVPAYVGYGHGDEGWAAVISANGSSRMQTYGEFLGRRYADDLNVIWVMGGDWGPVSGSYDLTDEINALAKGIKSQDDVHLMTAHDGLESAINGYDEPWLDLNNSYAYGGDVPSAILTDWRRPGPIPFFLIEGRYENSSGFSVLDVRQQAYQAVIGGAFGHLYGAHNVWYFDAESGESFASIPEDTWIEALSYPGAEDLLNLESLLLSRTVTTLVPDYNNRLITDGGGTLGDDSYAPCRVRPDGRVAVCYVPSQRSLSVDFSSLSGASIRVVWYKPSEGSSSVETTVEPSGTLSLQPPGSGDWVLLLDDIELNLPLPNGALPVRLASFEAAQQGRTIRLQWRTLVEFQNAGFSIERSVDGKEFQEIAFVEGQGRSDRPVDYSFVDVNLPTPPVDLGYRLRQVDLDGAMTFSDALQLALRTPADVVGVSGPYPEPATGEMVTVRIVLPTSAEGNVSIRMYDVNGRLIRDIPSLKRQGREIVESIPVNDLAAGSYFLRITVGPETTTRRVTVVR